MCNKKIIICKSKRSYIGLNNVNARQVVDGGTIRSLQTAKWIDSIMDNALGYEPSESEFDPPSILKSHQIMEDKTFVKEYQTYLFNCHCQGDIWAEYYYPYSFEEWIEKGRPKNGGNER